MKAKSFLSVIMPEGESFNLARSGPWVVAKVLLGLLKPDNWKRFRAGEALGVAWHVGPSWSSAVLDPWTQTNVLIGKSRLCRTIWARLEPGKLKWRDSPIYDQFTDWNWDGKAKVVPISEYKGTLTTEVSHPQQLVVHKSHLGKVPVESKDYVRFRKPLRPA